MGHNVIVVSMLLNCRIELGAGSSGTAGGNRVSVLHTKNLDVNSEGLIVDMTYFDSGKQSFVVCAIIASVFSVGGQQYRGTAARRQSHHRSGTATLPSVGAVP